MDEALQRELLFRKILLATECRMHGMIYENKYRKQTNQSIKYDEDSFVILAQELDDKTKGLI